MWNVAIIGGRLQGIEAVYLAKKAGFRSLLVDQNPKAPAGGFCDEMGVFDVVRKEARLIEFLKRADFILPALENDAVHAALVEIAEEHGLPLAFDKEAYAIASSKRKSDRLMEDHRIPAPRAFPAGGGPYILKPSEESGSAGVFRAETAEEVSRFLAETRDPESWVAQEYLEGPSYSIEIIGRPGLYRTYEVTEIHMDDVYDCKMVTAPCELPAAKEKELAETAEALANLIGLRGIMDVEVIDCGGALNVLEIDARLPSQTPMVVYHCSGVNLLAELAELTMSGGFAGAAPRGTRKYAALEHYLIDGDGVHSIGERVMGEGGPLTYRERFFGADEVLSDYGGGRAPWRGAFLNAGKTAAELAAKRDATRRALTEK